MKLKSALCLLLFSVSHRGKEVNYFVEVNAKSATANFYFTTELTQRGIERLDFDTNGVPRQKPQSPLMAKLTEIPGLERINIETYAVTIAKKTETLWPRVIAKANLAFMVYFSLQGKRLVSLPKLEPSGFPCSGASKPKFDSPKTGRPLNLAYWIACSDTDATILVISFPGIVLAESIQVFDKCRIPDNDSKMPLLQALAKVPGIGGITVYGSDITISRGKAFTWKEMLPEIVQVMRRNMGTGDLVRIRPPHS